MKRYLVDKNIRRIFGWRFNNKTRGIPRNKTLRIVLLSPSRVRWSVDDWKMSHDTEIRDTGLGTYVLDLPTASLPAGGSAVFTFFWRDQERWEGTDFRVVIEP